MKSLTREQIGHLLRTGRPFHVMTKRERHHALNGAVFLGIKITTRRVGKTPMYKVFFL